MRLFWIRAFWICAFVVAPMVEAVVTVENSGYSNVIVSFSQNIQANRSHELLETFKNSFNEASEFLQSAIGLRFSKVTFLIPQSWDISDWNVTVGSYTGGVDNRADIIIDGINDTAFGRLPFAEQYGDCGTPGRQVIVPGEFLLDQNSFPKGQILAREWLKFRYGIFDENGYLEDKVYPLFHNFPGTDPEDIPVTDCTNTRVIYRLKGAGDDNCSLSDETLRLLVTGQCFIEPDEESMKNVTSSLMYFHKKFQNMRHICGKEAEYSHSSTSPNKHNALCSGQSIWDVIKTSSDFSEEASAAEGEIEYTYMQEQGPKVVIAWEYTKKMKDKGKIVLTAIKKFMYDLPNGSKYAIFPFTDMLIQKSDYSLKELKDWPNDRKIDQLATDFVKPVDGCLQCAVQKAMEILSSDSNQQKTEGTIIIIASSNAEVKEELIQNIENSNLCLMFLVFNNDVQQDKFDPYTSASSCGSLVNLSKADNDLESFKLLFEAMESVLPDIIDDSVTKTVQTNYLPSEPVSIKIDSTVHKVTCWILGTKESEYMEFKFNGNIESMKEEVSSDIMAFSFNPSQEGIMTFRYVYDTDDTLTQVRVTSKPGQYINGDVFLRDTTKNDSQQMPVILYARIRFGSYPVQNADVSATVTRPNGETVNLETMYDDGGGDPDITKDDGIYSRYFTGFSEKGEYIATITAKNKGQVSTYGKILDSKGYQSCCGSFVERGASLFTLPEFSQTFTTSFHAVSGRPENGYKPSRILDFRIDQVTTDDKIVLKWTAPGAEADSGTVSGYAMKLLCDDENATECDFHKSVAVKTGIQVLNYGREQEVTIQLLTKIKPVTLVIESYNRLNETSDLSNAVTIILPADINEATTTSNPKPEDDLKQSKTGIFVGSIVGGIAIIACIIAAVLYCNKYQFKKEKTEIVEKEEGKTLQGQKMENTFNAKNHSTKNTPMRRIESFPVLLYTHDQIKDFKQKAETPPLYKRDIPAKSWASLDVLPSSKTEKSNSDITEKSNSINSSSTVCVDDSTIKSRKSDLEENPKSEIESKVI